MVLTEDEIRRVTKPDIYAVDCSVPGFSFRLSASGGRSWVLRAMMQGERREMGLGACRDVQLTRAVRKAAGFRRLIDRGLDPFAVLELGRQARNQYLLSGKGGPVPPDLPFLAAYFAHGFASETVHSVVQEYLVPWLGDLPLSVISADDLDAALQPLVTNPSLPSVQECISRIFRNAGLSASANALAEADQL